LLLDDTINCKFFCLFSIALNEEHLQKFKELEQEHSAKTTVLKQEQENLKAHV
jgi:hypothetical protein